MGNGTRYLQEIPSSHYWTDLEQLLEFFNHQEMSKEYLLTGLKNTKNNGYELEQLKQIQFFKAPHFIDINHMIQTIENGYDTDKFIKMLKNTINNGYDLMEVQKIFKIPISGIEEEDIEEYIHNVAIQLKKGNNMERKEVYDRIDVERDYQDLRWSPRREKNNTPDEQKPPAEWINYIEFHLNKAKESVYLLNEQDALDEVRKVAALAVRCMEIHGCPKRIIPKELK